MRQSTYRRPYASTSPGGGEVIFSIVVILSIFVGLPAIMGVLLNAING